MVHGDLVSGRHNLCPSFPTKRTYQNQFLQKNCPFLNHILTKEFIIFHVACSCREKMSDDI